MTLANVPRVSHDVPTWLRLIAISLIVASHFDVISYSGGGAYFLMIMVGFNIATFKLKKVVDSGSVETIAIMIVKVIIPAVCYTLILHLYYGPFRWDDVLLMANFNPERHPSGFSYWFVEVYIQLQIIFMLLLYFGKVRSAFARQPWFSASIFVIASSFIMFASEFLWDASDYKRRLPWLVLWMVAFGVMARFSDTWVKKLIANALFILVSLYFFGELNIYLVVCYFILVLQLPWRISPYVQRPINFLAAGSLFVYLTHFQVQAVMQKLLPSFALIHLLSALIIGALLFFLYNKYVNSVLLDLYYRYVR